MDKEKANIQKYSVLLKNSAFVSDGDCQWEPHTENEGALQLSTLKWRRGEVLSGSRAASHELLLGVIVNA